MPDQLGPEARGLPEDRDNALILSAVNLCETAEFAVDPRLLIAQATLEGITLLTSDEQVSAYPGPLRRV